MHKLAWLKTISAAAVTIAGLQLSGTAANADTQVIDRSSYWEATTDPGPNGKTVCGVRSHMTNGAELRLLVVDDEVHMVAHDPGWSMRSNAALPVSVNVDGDVYRGRALATDPRTLLMQGLTMDFLQQFVDGISMTADLGGYRWSVSLIGSSRATSAMVQCVTAARSGLVS
jgi:hypothetical protein